MSTPDQINALGLRARAVYAARLADAADAEATAAEENNAANRAKIDARLALANALGLEIKAIAVHAVTWPYESPRVVLEAEGVRFVWREYMDRMRLYLLAEGKCGHDLEAKRWDLAHLPDVDTAITDLGYAIAWAEGGYLCEECLLEEDGAPTAPYPPRPTPSSRLLEALRELVVEEVERAIENHSGGY